MQNDIRVDNNPMAKYYILLNIIDDIPIDAHPIVTNIPLVE